MNPVPKPDLAYLKEACARGHLPEPTGKFSTEELNGGRMATTLLRLQAGQDTYVVKLVPKTRWRAEGMGYQEGGEAILAQHPSIQKLAGPNAGPIAWPVIDVSEDVEDASGSEARPHDRLLTRDVGRGMRQRDLFSRQDSQRLFEALAVFHGAHYGRADLADLPLPDVMGTTSLFTEAVLAVAQKDKDRAGWIDAFLEEFQIMEAFLPLFLEMLGPTLADDYLDLVADTEWKSALGMLPATLLHGDLRRANIAFEPERVALIDWELASRGPPGADLQWHCFLHYWGYPPPGEDDWSTCEDLRDDYFRALKTQVPDGLQAGLDAGLHAGLDPDDFEMGWKLGWIRAVAMLGYVLVDSIFPDGGDANARERVRSQSARAIQRALQFRGDGVRT
jgi:hypothetical protein